MLQTVIPERWMVGPEKRFDSWSEISAKKFAKAADQFGR